MLSGVLYALLAGLMWGLIFVGPIIVPDYPAALQSTGRYLALGLIAMPIAWLGRKPARAESPGLVYRPEALERRKPDLLRLPGERHSAYRGAYRDDDHRHVAGGDPHFC